MNQETIQFHAYCVLIDSAKKDLAEAIESAFVTSGAKVEFTGGYPGWKPNMNSAILKEAREFYNKNSAKFRK
jgi:dipeptidase D